MLSGRRTLTLLAAIGSVLVVGYSFIFADLGRIQSILQPLPTVREYYPAQSSNYSDTAGAFDSERHPELSHEGEFNATYRPSCLRYNSEAWLKGPRFGNIREGITEEMTRRMLVDFDQLLTSNAPKLLDQSMCMSDSRFVTKTDEADANDPEAVRIWAVRLAYLAFHYHQNRLAKREAERRSSCTASDLEKYDIGPFDFECDRETKYAVFQHSSIGIGANIRGGAAIAMMAGLMSDRIVVFINKAPAESDAFKSSWPRVSCERGDHQCIFFPSSPCVLTIEDLNNAWIMPKHESRMFLMKRGVLPEEHKDDKVIRVVSLFQPYKITPRPVMEKLSKLAHEIIDMLPETDPRMKILRKAADSIAFPDNNREGYHYSASTNKIAHAAEIYTMRPTPSAYERLLGILEEVIPQDLDVETSIGLPIRASDKCLKESECLSFDEHMQIVDDLWKANDKQSSSNPTIVFTTESKSVLADQEAFVNSTERQSKLRHEFNFVTNTKDIMPNSGRAVKAHRFGGADEVMFSAMSSLMFQMKPRYSVGNCCSNFHILLADYLHSGCGSASTNTFMCLQEHPDPLLRVCCGWHKNCKNEKQAALEALAQNSA